MHSEGPKLIRAKTLMSFGYSESSRVKGKNLLLVQERVCICEEQIFPFKSNLVLGETKQVVT